MTEGVDKIFRMDNEVLAFRFTATVSDRSAPAPRERLTDPARLTMWLRAVGLAVAPLSPADLADAVALREAIYRIGAALAASARPDPRSLRLLNAVAAAGHATPVLDRGLARWRLTSTTPVADALGVLAADAVHTLGGPDRARVKTCDGPGCAGLFLDTSRGGNRRWCSMNTCGNKVKKLRFAES